MKCSTTARGAFLQLRRSGPLPISPKVFESPFASWLRPVSTPVSRVRGVEANFFPKGSGKARRRVAKGRPSEATHVVAGFITIAGMSAEAAWCALLRVGLRARGQRRERRRQGEGCEHLQRM